MLIQTAKTVRERVRHFTLAAMSIVVGILAPLGVLTQVAFAAAPNAPVNVRAYTGGNSIAVTWNPAPTGSTATYYDIWRNDTYVTTVEPINSNESGTTQRWIDTAVANSTAYTYNVVAFNANDEESAWSADATITHVATSLPTVTLDSSVAAAGLTSFFTAGKNEILTWYPKLVQLWGSQAGTPTSITLKAQAGAGLAYTSGTNIVFDTTWATAHATDPTAPGVFMHEMVHVFQSPDSYLPWIHEGMADYFRDYIYGGRLDSVPTSTQDWSIGYDKAAYFFDWISSTFSKPNFVKDLYVSFTPDVNLDFFKTQTGLTVGELWQQMNGTRLSSPLLFKNVGASMQCLDLDGGSTANFTDFKLHSCSANPWAQTYLWFPDSNTSNQGAIKILGKCVDVYGSGTADGTAVKLYTCNNTNAQKWIIMSNGALKNVNSSKCLQPISGGTASGTAMEIHSCSGGNIQNWYVRPPGMLKVFADFYCAADTSLSPAKMYACNDGQASQNFQYVQTSPGAAWGAIKSVNSNACLEPTGGSTASGAVIDLNACDGSASQQWQWQADNTVKNNYTGYCLTLPALASPWSLTQTTCSSPTTLKKFDVLYQY